MKIKFPDPRTADENGIVFVGGVLSEENLVSAYSRGIFPWPHKGLPLLWFSPAARGVLDFERFHVPRSVTKSLKKKNFRLSIDEAFEDVMRGCALSKRPSQVSSAHEASTWITPSMRDAYLDLHKKGYAHSVECWKNDELVGGLYGVYMKGVFSGESMFFKASDASKACLIHMVKHLKEHGHTWFDIQMVTPVLELFGGRYISREKYLERVKELQAQKIPWK